MINAIATKAISQAFDKSLKDAVLPFTGSRKGFGGDGGVYDPISDTYTNPTGATGDISYQGRGTFGGFTSDELKNNGIDTKDTKLLCLVAEVSEIPKVDDEISFVRLGVQEKLRVMSVTTENAQVTLVIQLRGM